MSLFRRLTDINNNDYNNKNHKWFIVSSYLFKGIYSQDRIKIQVSNNEIIGNYKFYLFSIYTVVLMVNNQEMHISFTEDDINKCYDLIVSTSTIRNFPIKVTKLSHNPNDWGMKDDVIPRKTLEIKKIDSIDWKVKETKQGFFKHGSLTSKGFIQEDSTENKHEKEIKQIIDFVVERSPNNDLSLKQIKPQMPTVTKDDIEKLKELLTKKIL